MKTNREKVIDALVEKSNEIDGREILGVSAQELSDKLKIQRTTVSLYLNDLVRSGDAIKLNTRPVFFIDRKIYNARKKDWPLIRKQLQKEHSKRTEKDPFDQLVGGRDSLKAVVEQMKSAVIYPPNGMSSLLVGDSGVGKSYIARLAYDYAKTQGYVSGDFIVLNCAEYADNPELLSSMLFGHTQGAFTGATAGREGMLGNARNGYLFLDEVHRLSPENQEKLFQYMDKGTYRPVGETATVRKSNARLIFATTERNNVDFLQTFLRRIPLVIQIPSYQERTLNERIDLITSLFMKEAKVIQRNLLISSDAVNIMVHEVRDGNIGKLASIIKLSCAEALLQHRDNLNEVLEIKLENLPDSSLDFDEVSHQKNDQSIQIDFQSDTVRSPITEQQAKLRMFAQKLIIAGQDLQNDEQAKQEYYERSNAINNQISDYISFDLGKTKQSTLSEYIEAGIKSILANFYLNFGINQFNSNANLLTKIILFINDYDDGEEITGLEETLIKARSYYSERVELAESVVNVIAKQINVQNSNLYVLLIFNFIFSQRKQLISRDTNAIIVAHGYSTASSIATTVNRLLGSYVFESFDMALDAGLHEVVAELRRYFKTVSTERKLILLVDMGSLTKLQTRISDIYDGSIAIMTNVSTASALAVGQHVLNNDVPTGLLDEIAGQTSPKANVLVKKKRERIILTTCITGIGAAKYLQQIIQESTSDEIKVVTKDFYELQQNGLNDKIFKDYNVRIIIGTDDPIIEEIPYLSVESLINRDSGDKVLLNAFPDIFTNDNLQSLNSEMVRAFTLDSIASNLTELKPEITVEQVENCVRILERSLGTKLDVYLKISLYMHLCFMLDRIVGGIPNLDYHNLQHFEENNQHFIKVIKDAFSEIQHYYQIEIPTSEIGFIYDILKNRIKIM